MSEPVAHSDPHIVTLAATTLLRQLLAELRRVECSVEGIGEATSGAEALSWVVARTLDGIAGVPNERGVRRVVRSIAARSVARPRRRA